MAVTVGEEQELCKRCEKVEVVSITTMSRGITSSTSITNLLASEVFIMMVMVMVMNDDGWTNFWQDIHG